jgi:hypothetical protein
MLMAEVARGVPCRGSDTEGGERDRQSVVVGGEGVKCQG